MEHRRHQFCREPSLSHRFVNFGDTMLHQIDIHASVDLAWNERIDY